MAARLSTWLCDVAPELGIARVAETAKQRCHSLRHEAKVSLRVACRFPSTIVLPFAFLIILLGSAVGAICYVRNQMFSTREVKTQALADSTAAAIQLQLQLSLQPVHSTIALIHRQPQYPELMTMFEPFVKAILPKKAHAGQWGCHPQAPEECFEAGVGLIANGYLAVAVPPILPELVGFNTLTAQGNEGEAEESIRSGRDVMYFDKVTQSFGVISVVYISGVDRNETFRFPQPITNCSACYDPKLRRRFWGFVFSHIQLSSILAPRVQDLKGFRKHMIVAPVQADVLNTPYPWRSESLPIITVHLSDHNPNGHNHNTSTKSGAPGTHAAGTSRPPGPAAGTSHPHGTSADQTAALTHAAAGDDGIQCYLISSSPRKPGRGALKAVAKVSDTFEWWILVEGEEEEVSVLANVLLVVAILGSLLLGYLLFATLISRRKLQMLLESLVPDAVIQQVRQQAGFLDSGKPILTAGSPADLMLKVASDIAAGREAAISDALTLRTAILQRWDLYTPINLGKQLQQGPLERDVAQALMNQLVGTVDSGSLEQQHWVPLQAILDASPGGDPESPLDMTWCGEAFNNLQLGLMALMSESAFRRPRSGTDVDLSSHVASFSGPVAVEEAERVLGLAASSWQFDAFELSEVTNGFPLSSLAFYLIHKQGLVHKFKLDSKALAKYLRAIEDGYCKGNPYHNNTHAADVLQSMHVVLMAGGLASGGFVDELTILAAYLAAVCHDYDHRGLTNDFLINAQDELAYKYNDRSPLENHHMAAAWSLLKQPGMNFLLHLSKPQMSTLRKTMIELVLATDMKQHFAIVTHFTATTSSHLTAGTATIEGNTNTFPVTSTKRGKPEGEPSLTMKVTPANDALVNCATESERLTVLQMALKCADLGHTAAALPVHKRWLSLLEEEFFRQGDLEAARSMPISPLFDRSKPGASKSQVGFYNVVVLPMYQAFCVAFPDASPLLEGAKANFRHWQAVQGA